MAHLLLYAFNAALLVIVVLLLRLPLSWSSLLASALRASHLIGLLALVAAALLLNALSSFVGDRLTATSLRMIEREAQAEIESVLASACLLQLLFIYCLAPLVVQQSRLALSLSAMEKQAKQASSAYLHSLDSKTTSEEDKKAIEEVKRTYTEQNKPASPGTVVVAQKEWESVKNENKSLKTRLEDYELLYGEKMKKHK